MGIHDLKSGFIGNVIPRKNGNSPFKRSMLLKELNCRAFVGVSCFHFYRAPTVQERQGRMGCNGVPYRCLGLLK